jgi:D-glycero-D-manno-heptose 1,7-bisphosphate phosphatase
VTASEARPFGLPDRPFVFLDRDGTLVRDHGYTHRVGDYALLPGVVPALRRLACAGYGLAIVTNQSGIGRGLFRLADYHAFERHLEADLAAHGVPVAASFFCPHTPEAGCACRKPAPGLLLRARDVLGAELARSWVIGDALRDVAAALSAGCAGAVCIAPARPAELPAGVHWATDLAAAADAVLGAQLPG